MSRGVWHPLQIQAVVSLVDKTLVKKEPEARRAAEAFIDYMFTRPAQEEFAKSGFRCGLQLGHCTVRGLGILQQRWVPGTTNATVSWWLRTSRKFSRVGTSAFFGVKGDELPFALRSAVMTQAPCNAKRTCTQYGACIIIMIHSVGGGRSIDKQLLVESHMPAVKQLWTVEGKLGGWIAAQKKFFDRRVRGATRPPPMSCLLCPLCTGIKSTTLRFNKLEVPEGCSLSKSYAEYLERAACAMEDMTVAGSREPLGCSNMSWVAWLPGRLCLLTMPLSAAACRAS